MKFDLKRRVTAEFLGTAFLLMAIVGSGIMAEKLSGGNAAVALLGNTVAIATALFALITVFGEISGAHFNPAVTFAFWTQRKCSMQTALQYVLSQLCGAMTASLTLKALFPLHQTLGATLPHGSLAQTFLLEAALTFLLMFVIIRSAASGNTLYVAVAVGAVVGLEAMFAGPLTGASMNPARSLAPAVASGQAQSLWIYLTAPSLGAWLGSLAASALTVEKKSSNT